ncbi:MAG: class I SAM-dependent methyltransferase [Bryobacteraceae bacterium]
MNFQRIAVNQPLVESFLDRIEIDAVGLIRVSGWSRRLGNAFDALPRVRLDGLDIPLLQTYRVSRPDVESAEALTGDQAGLVCEYLIPNSLYGRRARLLSLTVGEYVALQFEIDLSFTEPHYRTLFDSRTVLRRQEIYSAGPPNAEIHPDIVAVAQTQPTPILDFGCGSGALLSVLSATGVPCRGLELAGTPASASLSPSLRHLVTFYDGSFPSPVESGSAATVFCSEVLEHIPEYDAAIRDMARIATERVVITVPDSSAIALGSRHRLVPWHLLESTHVNFFNQSSLDRALRPYFKDVSFGRVCPCLLNDTEFGVSIVAYCGK